jgi:tetrathionate reductase subunit B
MSHWSVESRKRYAMVIDLRKCIGCHSCTVACKSENSVPLGVWRSWVKISEKGNYPNVSKHFLPRLCNHCDRPPCVRVCPTQATYKNEDGLILQRYERCIGCKYCMQACPYNARFMHPKWQVIDKCTFCFHRLAKGMLPSCVNSCPAGARVFGDLSDPESEVSKLVSKLPVQVLRPDQGTKPHVFYIMPDKAIMEVTPTHSYSTTAPAPLTEEGPSPEAIKTVPTPVDKVSKPAEKFLELLLREGE